MKNKLAVLIGTAVMALSGTIATPALAATAFVDFETSPSLPQGPSIYVAVPAQQTITTPFATFSGGVVLGLATFFPAIAFASSPNVYGTADFGNNLARTLSIDINPTFSTTQVSFALFNGETFNQSYVVNAFNGSSLVGSQTLTNVAPNFNSGYGVIDITSTTSITKLTVDAVGNPGVWDFLIDDVAFNQSLTNVITAPLPPVVQDPVPSVQVVVTDTLQIVDIDGHKQRRKGRSTERVYIDFGEDINDIRSTVLLDPTVQAVPEPSNVLLMLSGLGVVGWAAKRRRRPA